jgi:hypothetical protein
LAHNPQGKRGTHPNESEEKRRKKAACEPEFPPSFEGGDEQLLSLYDDAAPSIGCCIPSDGRPKSRDGRNVKTFGSASSELPGSHIHENSVD